MLCVFGLLARAADDGAHALWEIQGRHNTVYLLGSVHVLRPSDYPLAPALLDAYRNSRAVVMEVDLGQVDDAQMQAQMLAGALLSPPLSLTAVLGASRYAEAHRLAQQAGVELAAFERFAPWFAAEAVSALQLQRLGFEPEAGVEMYFRDRARADGKALSGLESVQDQLDLFERMSLDTQADYLMSSLRQARDLPGEVNDMVRAWRHGDTPWFEQRLAAELGGDGRLYEDMIVARNRKWLPKIEALLAADGNYLVIVGTGHLVGRASVLQLLARDGFTARQR